MELQRSKLSLLRGVASARAVVVPFSAFFARLASTFIGSTIAVSVSALVTGAFAGSVAQAVNFHILAQPLASALTAYSLTSGLELYYDGALAIGRESTAVIGTFEPDDALGSLLSGTGLVARRSGPRSLTITARRPIVVAGSSAQTYFAFVQTRVSEALCAQAETRPTSGDFVIQFWVSRSGEISRIRLLDAPPNTSGEDAFARALRGLQIGAVPPEGLPQPITMAILARTGREPSGCANTTMTAAR